MAAHTPVLAWITGGGDAGVLIDQRDAPLELSSSQTAPAAGGSVDLHGTALRGHLRCQQRHHADTDQQVDLDKRCAGVGTVHSSREPTPTVHFERLECDREQRETGRSASALGGCSALIAHRCIQRNPLGGGHSRPWLRSDQHGNGWDECIDGCCAVGCMHSRFTVVVHSTTRSSAALHATPTRSQASSHHCDSPCTRSLAHHCPVATWSDIAAWLRPRALS